MTTAPSDKHALRSDDLAAADGTKASATLLHAEVVVALNAQGHVLTGLHQHTALGVLAPDTAQHAAIHTGAQRVALVVCGLQECEQTTPRNVTMSKQRKIQGFPLPPSLPPSLSLPWFLLRHSQSTRSIVLTLPSRYACLPVCSPGYDPAECTLRTCANDTKELEEVQRAIGVHIHLVQPSLSVRVRGAGEWGEEQEEDRERRYMQ